MTNEYGKPEHKLLDRIPYLNDDEHAELMSLIIRYTANPHDQAVITDFLHFWGEFDPEIQEKFMNANFTRGMCDLFEQQMMGALSALRQLSEGNLRQVQKIGDICTRLGEIGQQFRTAVNENNWPGMVAAKNACTQIVEEFLDSPNQA